MNRVIQHQISMKDVDFAFFFFLVLKVISMAKLVVFSVFIIQE